MNLFKFTSKNVICGLVFVLSSMSSFSYTAQNAAAYTSAKRFNMSGQVVGTISADPDGSGALKYLATRNTYNLNGLLTMTESGYLSSWKTEDIAPSNWGSNFIVSKKHAFTYNSLGQKTTASVQTSTGNKQALTQFNYDVYGRLNCKAVRMNTAVYSSYPDSVDACVLGTKGDFGHDRITQYTYNDFDQVLTETRAKGTSIEQIYVTNTYDQYYRLENTTDAAGNLSHLTYDLNGRLEKFYFPDKSTVGGGGYNNADYEKYTYDNNGNRTALRKRDGRTIYYQYDNLNQNIYKNWPSTTAKDVYYDYDLRGLELHARYGSDSGLGVIRTYDGFGNMKTEKNTSTGSTYILSYQYDNHGNRERVTFPDGKYFQYAYDQLNRATTIKENNSTTLITNVYDHHGRLNYLNRSSYDNTTLGYDDVSRLETLNNQFSGSSYDNVFGYEYSPANQLTQLTISNALFNVDPDVNGQTGSYVPNGLNQYASVNGKTMGYDSNGNLTNDGEYSYSYDVENRLITASKNNSSLTYDPLGRLSSLTSGGSTKKFLYSGDSLVAEYSGSTLTNRYVHGSGIDDPLVQYLGSTVSSTNRRYLYSNHQGSIVGASNQYGTKLYINTYDSYGVADTANQGRFGYTGQLTLNEIGLNYYKARIYHPKLGRFLQTDPVGYEDQMNLYAYVGNDPVNMVDPTGEVGIPGFLIGAGLDIVVQLATGTDFGDLDYVQAGVAGVAGAVGAGIGSAATKLASVASMGKNATVATKAVGDVASSVAGTVITGGELSVEGVAANIAGGKALGNVGGAIGKNLPASAKNITSQMKPKGSPNSRKGNRKLNRQANAQIKQTQASRAVTGAAIGSGAGGRAAGCLTAEKC